MDKNNYFNLRQHSPMSLLYIYYKEKFNSERHTPFLQEIHLLHYLNMWGDLNLILEKVFAYYEAQLQLVKVYDKEGKLIKVI